MCEQLGKEPNPDEMPLEVHDFPEEMQEALVIHQLLPDRWDGSSGSYLGKDWSVLGTLLAELHVQNRQQCIFFIKNIEARHSQKLNRELARERKRQENKAKHKR